MVTRFPIGYIPFTFNDTLPLNSTDTSAGSLANHTGALQFADFTGDVNDPTTLVLTFVIFDYPNAANSAGTSARVPIVEILTEAVGSPPAGYLSPGTQLAQTAGTGTAALAVPGGAVNYAYKSLGSGLYRITFTRDSVALNALQWQIRFTINDGVTSDSSIKGLTFSTAPDGDPWLVVPGQQSMPPGGPLPIDIGTALSGVTLSGATGPAKAIMPGHAYSAAMPLGNYGTAPLVISGVAATGATNGFSLQLTRAPVSIAPGSVNTTSLQASFTAPAGSRLAAAVFSIASNDPLTAGNGPTAHFNTIALAARVSQAIGPVTPKWTVKPAYNDGAAAVDQGLVVYGEMGANDAGGACLAVRLADGANVWRCPVPATVNVMSEVHTEAGIAYFIATFLVGPGVQNKEQSYVYAVNLATGAVKWHTLVDGWAYDFLIRTEGLVAWFNKSMKPVAITDEDIHYRAVVLDKSSGAVKVDVDLGPGAITAQSRSDRIALVHANRPWIDMLDPKSWTISRLYTAPQPIQTALFYGDRCYIGISPIAEGLDPTGPSWIAAINLTTGAPDWMKLDARYVWDLSADGQNVFAAMYPAPGESGTSISLLNAADGTIKWTVPAGSKTPVLGPVVAGSLVAQIEIRPNPQTTAITIGLDVLTGAEIFRCELPYSTNWVIDAGNGMIVSSHHDNVFMLDLNHL